MTQLVQAFVSDFPLITFNNKVSRLDFIVGSSVWFGKATGVIAL